MGMDSAEPSGFWDVTHTEISWTELDTVKLADRKPVPLLDTLYVTGPDVYSPDGVPILKTTKQKLI